MEKLFGDFETRSRIDLRKCGVSVYARSNTTTALCFAYKINTGPVQLWIPGQPLPADLRNACENPDCEFHAHNAAFEIAIWQEVMVPDFDWPELDLTRWHCTAAKCAARALPRSLDQVAKALKLEILKDDAGRRVMMQLCKPRKPSKNNPDEWFTKEKYPEKYETLYKYCMNDVAVEYAVDAAVPDLSTAERNVWLFDQRVNGRGIPIDLPSVDAAIRLADCYNAGLMTELKTVTGGEVTTGRQTQRLLKWFNHRGVNIDNIQAPTVKAELKKKHPADVQRVLEIRKELGLSSLAKFQAMQRMSDADGRVRGAHLYHGATTGRWSGRGVQFQNIARGKFPYHEVERFIDHVLPNDGAEEICSALFGDVPTALSSSIRSMVKARKGHELHVCDFSGIEARVLAWLAGEEWLIDAFRNNAKIYEIMAGQIYNVKPENVTKEQRQVGKIAVLGLGYQMGWPKFRDTCEKYGVFIPEDLARRVVDVYRETNGNIRQYWYDLSYAAIGAVRCEERRNVDNVTYYPQQDWLMCRLPSGRSIAYYDPVIRQVEAFGRLQPRLNYFGTNLMGQWGRVDTYGGKLCENVVQAVARDFLVVAMQRLEAAGYPVIFHVHDEAVSELPIGQGSIGEMETIMCKLPSWGTGCPIGAEGFTGTRYRK